MIFNKSIRAVVLALVLGVWLWLGMGPDWAIAAPPPVAKSMPERLETLPEASLALETAVDRFLTSMPTGYYAIANVAGLKSQLANPDAVLVDVREPVEAGRGCQK